MGDDWGYYRIDQRVDVGFLDTTANHAEISPTRSAPGYGHYHGRVSFPWKPEFEHRMQSLQRDYNDLIQEGIYRYPGDVGKRFDWIETEMKGRIIDQIYFQSGEVTYFNNDFIHKSPFSLHPSFTVDDEKMGSFISLMERYQENFCGAPQTA